MASKIKEFYENKNVLLTGGTGYLGKLIIEKLLRTTNVKTIFLIVRSKQDIAFHKRISKMFEEQVNIVFHCGASLNMDSNLVEAVMTNINGTAAILDLMKGAESMDAFVLVSTAYSNCLNNVVDEIFYEPPIDPKLLIRIVEDMKPDLLNIMSNGSNNPVNYKPLVMNFSGNSSSLYMSIKDYTSLAANSGYLAFKKTIWKPMLIIIESEIKFLVLKCLLHTLPAYLFDLMFMIIGRKPKLSIVYKKLDKVMGVLHYFLVREWIIKNENVKALWEKLTPNDRITYNFDVRSVQAETYLRSLMDGLKKYTLKEDMSKAESHKARYERYMFCDLILLCD
ncbi:unnamed protein product [Ceutorhynchus assimilis]|uniref:Fatty acyl-CoA reductase n=1 Tax=Ceutorhynchus assimilis TaxID=467358 RepID=A0A9N9ML70_9CUCU|nr:unnamed protein product [Ceutorhynchus assimilis]